MNYPSEQMKLFNFIYELKRSTGSVKSKRSLRHLLIQAAIVGLCSCSTDTPQNPGVPPLVVEGWIEEGMAPVVMVTRAVDLTADTASFDGFVQRWARVSIFDNGKQYMLSGHTDKNYMPPFIFTTSRLHGEVGHTYRLLVETDTDTVESTATLLPAPGLKKLVAIPENEDSTLFSIQAYVEGLDEGAGCKLFARVENEDTRFYPTFLGTFLNSQYDSEKGWNVTRGVHSSYSDAEFSHFFSAGDRVAIRACSLQPSLYEFWNVYDANISLSQNLFFTFSGNCPSNIDGGLGYWAAYGMVQRAIRIPVKP